MRRKLQPFKRLEEIADRLDEVTREVEREMERGEIPSPENLVSRVSVDVADLGDEVLVRADLPGFEKDEISVQANEETVTLSADSTEESEIDEEDYHRKERRHESLSRTLRLPAAVEAEDAEATYDNGVLELRLPKKEVETGESIEIE
ncbi:MAG: Hsp20/alpha crystallin family protein [Halobacteria archaeon]|nr:Hsp20/alpha crystallin family protein [Halobacteria archaeon]